MIKVGDKAKGFEFDEGVYEIGIKNAVSLPNCANEIFLRCTEYTNRYIGVEGTIAEIYGCIFRIEFDKDCACWYPISKYLALQREEKLNELGI